MLSLSPLCLRNISSLIVCNTQILGPIKVLDILIHLTHCFSVLTKQHVGKELRMLPVAECWLTQVQMLDQRQPRQWEKKPSYLQTQLIKLAT